MPVVRAWNHKYEHVNKSYLFLDQQFTSAIFQGCHWSCWLTDLFGFETKVLEQNDKMKFKIHQHRACIMAWCRTGGNQLSKPMLTLFIHVYMRCYHYNDVIMSAMASQIIGVSIVSSTVCSGADQRKRQSSASLAFESGIHRSPVNATLKGPVTRKKFPFDDVIMVGRWVKRSELRTSQQIQVKTKHIGRNKFEQATSHSLDEWWPSSRMHWGWDKMAAISQTTFRDAFSSLTTVAFQLIQVQFIDALHQN